MPDMVGFFIISRLNYSLPHIVKGLVDFCKVLTFEV